MNYHGPMNIPENRKLSAHQQRVNFTEDRDRFERAMAMIQTKAPEFFSKYRTKDGYSDPQLQAAFYGWRLKCEDLRERVHPTTIKPQPIKLAPQQIVGTIHRTPTIWWGNTEFKAPDRQEFGVSTGYVLVQGRDWPKLVALEHGQIVYDRNATGSQADYVDVVCVAAFDMADDAFATTLRAISDYTLSLMSDRNVHVKTHLSLPSVESPEGPVRCEVIRLMIEHNEFLADQARGEFYDAF